MADVVGWAELMKAQPIQAAFVMFNTAFAGWIVVVLFVLFQSLLLIKTKNMTLAWTTGILFSTLFITALVVKPVAIQIIFGILVFELAGILYFLFMKK